MMCAFMTPMYEFALYFVSIGSSPTQCRTHVNFVFVAWCLMIIYFIILFLFLLFSFSISRCSLAWLTAVNFFPSFVLYAVCFVRFLRFFLDLLQNECGGGSGDNDTDHNDGIKLTVHNVLGRGASANELVMDDGPTGWLRVSKNLCLSCPKVNTTGSWCHRCLKQKSLGLLLIR